MSKQEATQEYGLALLWWGLDQVQAHMERNGEDRTDPVTYSSLSRTMRVIEDERNSNGNVEER